MEFKFDQFDGLVFQLLRVWISSDLNKRVRAIVDSLNSLYIGIPECSVFGTVHLRNYSWKNLADILNIVLLFKVVIKIITIKA